MKQTKEWKVYLVESLGYTAFYGTGLKFIMGGTVKTQQLRNIKRNQYVR